MEPRREGLRLTCPRTWRWFWYLPKDMEVMLAWLGLGPKCTQWLHMHSSQPPQHWLWQSGPWQLVRRAGGRQDKAQPAGPQNKASRCLSESVTSSHCPRRVRSHLSGLNSASSLFTLQLRSRRGSCLKPSVAPHCSQNQGEQLGPRGAALNPLSGGWGREGTHKPGSPAL